MQTLLSYFFSNYRYGVQAHWFKKALYIFVTIKCAYWLCYFPLYFGCNAMVYVKHFSIGPLKDLAFLLYNRQWPPLSACFIITTAALCLFSFFWRKTYFFSDALIWFMTLNIHNQAYPTLSGGDYLLNQFLLFNCFLLRRFTTTSDFKNQLQFFFHNLASLAVIIQVCLAYLLSAAAKLFDPFWLNGQAIDIILKTNHFSLWTFSSAAQRTGWFAMVLNYLVLAYQAAFVGLVFIKKIKKIFLVCGVLMHLYIAVVMGLPWFAATMIIGYIFFWPFVKRNAKSFYLCGHVYN